MHTDLYRSLTEALSQVNGYIYPNDISLVWSIVIVVYPYITGLVAGAFILASLVRIFNVHKLEPIYRLSLLTALAFLLVAPLPLLVHLGHPERCFEVMITPHVTSPMAIFGFVYAWYLMAVLLLELWFDYRRDFVIWSKETTGLKSLIYKLLTLGVTDLSDKAIRFDNMMGKAITFIGIPSAFLLHGYVGFIFGSVKANPWWGTVLMPIIFIFSAMVSGIALLMFLYIVISWIRRTAPNQECLDTIAVYLFYALVLDPSIESLDWIHRLYEAEESIDVLVLLASGKLFYSFLLVQVFLGTVLPLFLLGTAMIFRGKLPIVPLRRIYLVCSILIMVGIFAMRWNVVIGGQLFSKSLRGFTTYKLELLGPESLLMAFALMALPFIFQWLLMHFFLPAPKAPTSQIPASTR